MQTAWNKLKKGLTKIEAGMKRHYRHVKEDMETVNRAEEKALDGNPFDDMT